MELFRKKALLDPYPTNGLGLLHCLTALDLTLFGIGAVIGAGIFVLTGIAAANYAGPGIILSYIIAGLACTFAALSYAELAASIGGCGSAYGYAYVGLGEIIAWIIGWDLILEYAISVSTVSIGWSQYLNNVLQAFHFQFPVFLLKTPLEGGYFNLLAVLIVVICGCFLILGAKASAKFNAFMVSIKLIVIGLFIVIAVQHIDVGNWQPFLPFGWHGVMSGAALIFFAYVGFDAVSTAAEEVINPKRDLPIGIIASLLICTCIYIIVAALLTGLVPYQTLNVSSPISHVLLNLGYRFSSAAIAVGAIAGLTTVILVMYYGLTRVFLAMSRDQLLPSFFAKLNPSQSPGRIIIFSGCIMTLFSGFVPIRDLAELVNIGTLFAFIVVCIGVIVLRIQQPDLPRPFKSPFFPFIPLMGIIFCAYLVISLPWVTWLRFFIWMSCGMLFYIFYSYHHSHEGKKSCI